MTLEEELLEDLASYSTRPFDFVIWAYPWGEAGTELAKRKGPEGWQARVLLDLQDELQHADSAKHGAITGAYLQEAYQIAIKSGHDVGKTAFLSWMIQWALTTREDTRGRATANTEKQLSRILWSELAKWHRLLIVKDFFKVSATAMYSSDPVREKTWRIDATPWSEDNTEAFAGLHNFGKRIIIVFDEASAIHDKIWEVTDGVTNEADTEIIWIATGNPTRAVGRFRDCFSRFSETWKTYTVDSREVSFTNKDKIDKAIAQWGLDSDYVRVRFLGEFPDAATTQLIPTELIGFAETRRAISYAYESLILGVDVARYGDNESVAAFRRGKDARTIEATRWRGLSVMETGQRIANLITQHYPDATFIDEGGVGGGVVDYVRHLGHSVIGVNFGGSASGRVNGILVANKRAEMYVALREWLREGGAIQVDEDLRNQLTSINFFFQKRTSAIILEAKEDMEGDSPDFADALALTFAYPVVGNRWRRIRPAALVEYDPFSQAALTGADMALV